MTIDVRDALLAFYLLAVVAAVWLGIASSLAVKRAPKIRDARITKLEGDVDDFMARVNKLAGRIGRQARDERQADIEDDQEDGQWQQRKGESAAEWKLRTRKLINQGKRPGA